MGYKIQLYDADNTTFKLKDGFVLKDELNETLDSGLITFFSTYSLDDIEPFDNVNISETNNTHLKSNKNILIDSYEEDITCFGSTFENGEYKYTMTLFSETKELERIVLPNCSTTQPINGGNTITVLDEIQRFVKLYGLKIKVGTVANFSYQPKYTLAAAVSTKFAGVKCPEFQWNRPTLREVLNDLMSTKDCIVTLENNRIGLIDLSARGNQIDTTKLLYSKRSMSSQDYVGELSIDMQNAIGNNRTTVCEYISLRAPDGEATLTTENAVIRTQHPIYAIKKLEMYGVDTNDDDEGNDKWVGAEFTEHVCEKDEWELLSNVAIGTSLFNDLGTFRTTHTNTNSGDGVNFYWKLHKVNKLYYERGKNEIKNIGKLYNTAPLQVGDTSFFNHVMLPVFRHSYNPSNYTYDTDPRIVIVKLEYETVVENSMNVGKYLPNHHPNNRTVDNQTNSYVDIEHQSVFEYAKANRLGNKIREVGGNYSNDNQIPKLGDRIGNEILFSRELCYWDNMVQFKGFLAPNYVLKDFYTGIAAKKRAWQIASESDALTRHDVYKLYVEASFKEKIDDWDTQSDMPVISISKLNNSLNVMEYLVSCFESYNSFGGIRYAVCSTKDSGNVYYPDKSAVKTMGIVTDTNVEIQGMSVCFNFGYEDNFKSADYVSENGGEYKQSFYAYADGNGEFLTHHIELIGDIWGLGDGINNFSPVNHTVTTSKTLTRIAKTTSRGKPKIPLSGAEYNNMGLKMSFNVKKDNREIIKHTVQFEYCSDSENIIVGKKLIELSRLCNSNNLDITTYKFHWYLSGTGKYELGQEKDTGGSERSVTASDLVVETSAYSLAVTVNIPTTAIRWAITDSSNNIILAVNGSKKTVFFNLLRDRDTNIYDSTDKKTIVGKLGD